MCRHLAGVWTIALLALAGPAAAQQSAVVSHAGEIPQAIRLEHEETIRHLTAIARRRAPVGTIAAKALEVMRKHHIQESAFILPPLTLLQSLSEGKVSPDMRWAIAMADKVKAEKEQIFAVHVRITELMTELRVAAEKAKDEDAKEFAVTAVADALNDMEVQEPTTMLIGEYLRVKLPATP